MTTIASALARARAAISMVDARLLLRHVLGCTAAYLEAHREDELPVDAATRFADLAARRAAGEPIAYLIGVREFYGRDFEVGPEVLIPRPETELLVELGLAKLRGIARPRLLELGTGSGCIAVTLALEVSSAAAQVTAADISPGALALARRNADRHAAAISFLHSDWFAALGETRCHLIVANPPYIPCGDPHLAQGDLRFEPSQALTGGVDGLEAIRVIVGQAMRHLLPGGWLLFEHGHDQAEAARALLQDAGFEEVEQHRDLAGIVRVSGGCSKLQA